MPGTTCSALIRRSPAPSRTSASAGVRSISARMANRARSSVRASSAWATENRNTTVAASDHWPSQTAPAAAISMRTLMSTARARMAVAALRAVSAVPAPSDATKHAMASTAGPPVHSAIRPRARAAAAVQSSPCRTHCRSALPPTGASCSSHARMPVSATASAIAAAEIFAASYLTCSRCPMTSAAKPSRPATFLKRRSSMATSSRQSIPSILKVDSACSSQVAQDIFWLLRFQIVDFRFQIGDLCVPVESVERSAKSIICNQQSLSAFPISAFPICVRNLKSEICNLKYLEIS